MKKYKREYELVFSDNESNRKRCDLSKISIANSNLTEEKYEKRMRDELGGLQKEIYPRLVRISWLMRQFCYRNNRRRNFFSNGIELDRAFGIYVRDIVGYDTKLITGQHSMFSKILTYFDDFYPNFDEEDPFVAIAKQSTEYDYPYEHMTFECLYLVYKMPERLELLDEGEKQKMGITEFMDYVNNYISCYNEEHGETYIFNFSHSLYPYIRIVKTYEEPKTGNVRPGRQTILS